MVWVDLTSTRQLLGIYMQSLEKTVVIFKQSNPYPSSESAAAEMEKVLESTKDQSDKIVFARVLVIQNRDVSNKIAEDFFVHHESPQVIILKERKVVYKTSHQEITSSLILDALSKVMAEKAQRKE